jgi:3-phosphoshikimate 1-carboxyvinyltransferase
VPIDEIAISRPASPLDATVSIPGSKSITNRALVLATMAQGRSVIDGVLLSDDTRQMAAALRALGFGLETDEPNHRIVVDGRGGRIGVSGAELNIGGAGTAMRFLAGFVTLGRGRFRIDGNQRMRERPIGGLVDALRTLGVDATTEGRAAGPPIVIDTSAMEFEGGEVSIDASLSSQFVSALLMPAPLWRKGLKLTVKGDTARPFIRMTLRLMELWGAHSTVKGDTIVVPGNQRYDGRNFTVEPDASSASYFAAAAALVGGRVTITGLARDSIQGDTGVFAILARMGARVTWNPDSVTVSGDGTLSGIDVAMNDMPDMVATVAAIAPFASSPTRIRKVGFIRHHESDRIAALATELRRLGALVREFDDGLEIAPSEIRPVTIETYEDHRIAMAFAVAGLKLGGMRIRNPGCVAKTYPDFFTDLVALCK